MVPEMVPHAPRYFTLSSPLFVSAQVRTRPLLRRGTANVEHVQPCHAKHPCVIKMDFIECSLLNSVMIWVQKRLLFSNTLQQTHLSPIHHHHPCSHSVTSSINGLACFYEFYVLRPQRGTSVQ